MSAETNSADNLRDRIIAGAKELHAILRGPKRGHEWRASIPPNPKRDTDLLLADALEAGAEALRRMEKAEAEQARIYGIAKMRERRIGNLLGHLEFIAAGGCESLRTRGVPCDPPGDDEDASAPCNPCIARIARAQVTL